MLDEALDAKALITGASGFIGGRLREALLEAGADVLAIRRSTSPEPPRGRSVVCDYEDRAAVERLIEREKPDFVFHAAGSTKGRTYDDFRRANVMPTQHLAEAIAEKHPRLTRFVLVSSLASYGPSSPERPHEESFPRRPIEHYGKSKLQAEQVLETLGEALCWTILRPGGVYGPGDVDYYTLFREIERGRNVYFGNRRRWFSAVYVDDMVRAIVACAAPAQTVSRGYFVSDGLPVTWQQFQDAIIEASGRSVRTFDLPEFLVNVVAVGGELVTMVDNKPRLFNRQKAKMGAQPAWTCRADAARRDFDFQAAVPLAEGVRRSLRWYRDSGWV